MKSRYSFEKDSMFSFDICNLKFVILILPPPINYTIAATYRKHQSKSYLIPYRLPPVGGSCLCGIFLFEKGKVNS